VTVASARAFIAFFETLQPASLARLADHFTEDAHFVDPFNDAHGLAAIRRVFEHMFATCPEPRFQVDEAIGDGEVIYLRWRFMYGRDDARRTIRGVSRLRFDASGRVSEHRDYWDPARQLYEHIPLLGALLRAVRRRLGAATPAAEQHFTTDTQR